MTRNRPTVVFSGPAHSAEIARETLEPDYQLIAIEPELESLAPAFRNCTVFLDASMKVPISAQLITEAKQLKLVVTATTGATHIDQQALEQRNIPLLTLKGQTELLRGLTPAAELSWALVMACARHLRGALKHVESGGWERTQFPGLMLKGRTLGLIGIGRIGGWMARYGHAFGMDVVFHDPYQESVPEYAKSVSLDKLVSMADVISLHLHVTDETKGIINSSLIERFKEGAILINSSRGELCDEPAVVEGLKSGRIGALGVDVLMGEPEVEKNPIWQYAQDHDNVVITPHIGGFCPDAVDKVVAFSAKRIREQLEQR